MSLNAPVGSRRRTGGEETGTVAKLLVPGADRSAPHPRLRRIACCRPDPAEPRLLQEIAIRTRVADAGGSLRVVRWLGRLKIRATLRAGCQAPERIAPPAGWQSRLRPGHAARGLHQPHLILP